MKLLINKIKYVPGTLKFSATPTSRTGLSSLSRSFSNVQPPTEGDAGRAPLADTLGRRHNYLRISLTERCNLRCQYCMPAEGVPLSPRPSLLTRAELERLVRVFAALGVDKLRLTGGEPTLRPDLADVIGSLRAVEGIRSVSLTTNGLVLTRRLPALQRAGLGAINVSLDTLRPDRYEHMSRRAGLPRVLAGVDLALQLGYRPVKVNTVLMKGFNDDEICDFVEYTRDREVEVRFIEFMPFAGNQWEDERLVPRAAALAAVRARHPALRPRAPRPHDTAEVWQVPGYAGSVGFISSMTQHFCSSCNRLRLTADGNLKVCLFGAAEVSLRDAARAGSSDAEIADLVRAALRKKQPKHAARGPRGLRGAARGGRGYCSLTHSGGARAYRPPTHAGGARGYWSPTHAGGARGYWSPTHASGARGYCSLTHSGGARAYRPPTHAGGARGYWSPTHASGARGYCSLTHSGGARAYRPPTHAGGARGYWSPTHASGARGYCSLSHLDAEGRARMVDVGAKPVTARLARASCSLRGSPRLMRLLRDRALPKGDVLAVAEVAGVLGAKRAASLIPLCHPLPLDVVRVDVTLGEAAVRVQCSVRVEGRTGAEMEALAGAAVAALTVYDMCKAVDKHMTITDLRLDHKEGGTSAVLAGDPAPQATSSGDPAPQVTSGDPATQVTSGDPATHVTSGDPAPPESSPRRRSPERSPLRPSETYAPTNFPHF